jgi:two-component system, NarL family, nitrate/nitrite response regulator NarL
MSLLQQQIRVLVVDDHQLVRNSLLAMLARESDIQVVETATNGLEAIDLAIETTPDVIVMDVSMPELDGIRAAGRIKELGLPCIIILLSMHYNNTLLRQARKNGVAGYIMKQDISRDLIPAIRAASEGNLSF